ncbi:hypothetical protein HGB07_00445, partial [Candidatus Roizmanbacteria bacterium]|nr:hypothetical protein [Candidatus Roizmanbacteria bacterium]
MLHDKHGKALSNQEVTGKIFGRLRKISLEFYIYLLTLAGYIPSHHVRRFFYRLGGMKIGKGS